MERSTRAIEADELSESTAFLRRLARSLVADEHEAEDLAQDALVRALERPPRRAVLPRGWLATVVRRLAVNRARAEARRSQREGHATRAEAQPSHTETLERLEVSRAVLDAVLALREPYRTTIRLRYLENLPPRLIAARQGVSVKTVKSRLLRALAQLRSELDAENPEGRASWSAVLLSVAYPHAPLAGVLHGGGAWLGGLLVTKPLIVCAALIVCAVALWTLPSKDEAVESSASEVVQLDAALVGPTEEGRAEMLDASGDSPERRMVGLQALEPLTGALVVRLSWPAGTPAAQVPIDVLCQEDPAPRRIYHRARTDGEGVARWDALAPGPCRVYGDRGGSWKAEVVAGEEREFAFAFEEGLLVHGRVIDHEGEPVGGAGIWVDRREHGAFLAETAGDGSFALRHVSRGLPLGARKPGHGPSPQIKPGDLPADGRGARVVELQLGPPGGRVAGRVVDPEGKPVPGAQVKIGPRGGHNVKVTPTLQGTAPVPVLAESGPDGAFSYPTDVAPGADPIHVCAHGFPVWGATIEVRAGTETWVDVALEEPATVVGRVLDGGGNPVPGASVVAAVEIRGGWYHSPFPSPRAESDAEGRYRLGWVPSGAQELNAHPPSRSRLGKGKAIVQLAPGAEVEQDLVLDPGLTITGRVLDPQGTAVEGLAVQASHSKHQAYPRQDYTDASGRFVLPNLAEGEYDLSVHDPENWSIEPLVEHKGIVAGAEGVELVVDRAVVGARLLGKLVGIDGRSPTDVDVLVRKEGSSRAAYTNYDPRTGSIEYGPIAAGRWRIEISRSFHLLHATDWIDVEAGATRDIGTIRMEAPGAIEVVVLGLPDDVVAELSGRLDRPGFSTMELASEEGMMHAENLAAGSYVLNVGAPSGDLIAMPRLEEGVPRQPWLVPDREIEVLAGETTAVEVQAEPAFLVQVSGRCDEPWGRVFLEARSGEGVLVRRIDRWYGAAGPFEMELPVPEGTFSLEAWTDGGHRGQATVTAGTSFRQRVELTLR